MGDERTGTIEAERACEWMELTVCDGLKDRGDLGARRRGGEGGICVKVFGHGGSWCGEDEPELVESRRAGERGREGDGEPRQRTDLLCEGCGVVSEGWSWGDGRVLRRTRERGWAEEGEKRLSWTEEGRGSGLMVTR